jgi:RPA family protein
LFSLGFSIERFINTSAEIKSGKMRATAYKVRIEDLVNGEYRRSEDGTEPAHLLTPWGQQLVRARVMGTVVDKFVRDDGSYGTLTLDDGSGVMRIKAWGEDVRKIARVGVGELVDVIGRVREFEGEVYLAPDAVIKVEDPNWETVRILELVKLRKKMLASGIKPPAARRPEPHKVAVEAGTPPEIAVQAAPKIDEEIRERVLEMLKRHPQGATSSDLQNETKLPQPDVERALRDLLAEGRVYEPEPGRYVVV